MRILIFLFVLSSIYQASAATNQLVKMDSTVLPKVFRLGEHEKAYEKLYDVYNKALLEVCDDDMNLAFQKWLSMLEEMEAYATSIEYDIKGIKVWLNVFWNPDGSIRHIAYHLKVNSRNVDRDELSAFFSSFMNHYKFPMITESHYSHYGSASFPTFARRTKSTKNSNSANSKKDKTSSKDSVRSKY